MNVPTFTKDTSPFFFKMPLPLRDGLVPCICTMDEDNEGACYVTQLAEGGNLSTVYIAPELVEMAWPFDHWSEVTPVNLSDREIEQIKKSRTCSVVDAPVSIKLMLMMESD
jgi:hypothetical protein